MARMRLPLLIVIALALLGLAPALASADVYCVNAAGDAGAIAIDPSCGVAEPTIQAGLSAAETHAGEDTVLVGPGDYTLPAKASGDEVTYLNTNAGNVLHLRGIGTPHLTMGSTQGTQFGVHIEATAGSSVEGLRLTIPENLDGNLDRGFRIGGLGGVLASNLAIDGPIAYNANAIELTQGARLSNSTITLPTKAASYDAGIVAFSGDAEVDTSTIRAGEAVRAAGAVFQLERSTLVGWRGTETDGGTIEVRDSLIELEPVEGAIGIDLANENMGVQALNAVVSGTTIVGGGANSTGIRVQANDSMETATATISDSIITGQTHPIEVRADNGRTAKAVVGYSNYDIGSVLVNGDLNGTGATGTAILEQSGITGFDPGFVNAAAGDYRLAASSQLIDVGDPTAPPASELDLAGSPRALSATACPPAAGRRDIGAYEFVPTCAPPGGGSGTNGGGEPPTKPRAEPRTKISGKHKVETADKRGRVVLTLSSPTAGASFRCSVDAKPFHTCKPRLVLHLKPGRHTVRAYAVVAGVRDQTPAKAVVKVVAEPS